MKANREYTEEKKVDKLSKDQVSLIYSYVNDSMGIQISEKGKKTINGDIARQMLKYNNDVARVLTYFENYSQEMKKLYIWGWDTYEKIALSAMLTRR